MLVPPSPKLQLREITGDTADIMVSVKLTVPAVQKLSGVKLKSPTRWSIFIVSAPNNDTRHDAPSVSVITGT